MSKRDRYIQDDLFKKKRRRLRSIPTKAEYILWQELRKNKLGYRFRRQTSIGPFIVDFYCQELFCIIEVDGSVHEQQKEYDKMREGYLKEKGYDIIRFQNDEVIFKREIVIEKIIMFCKELDKIRG